MNHALNERLRTRILGQDECLKFLKYHIFAKDQCLPFFRDAHRTCQKKTAALPD